MNKNMLESVMKLHGDTGGMLAEHLHIARSTFSAKIMRQMVQNLHRKKFALLKKSMIYQQSK